MSQKSESRANTNPKIIPDTKADRGFMSSTANNNGTSPNQARKWSPIGWKAREINSADSMMREILVFNCYSFFGVAACIVVRHSYRVTKLL